MRRLPVFFALLASASMAHAADKVLYAPAPDWVKVAPEKKVSRDENAPVVVVMDNQQRIADGQVWTYTESATRVASNQVQAQLGTISLPWMPDKGDLTVHGVEILRGTERINLIAGDTGFTVLRREQALEQLAMDGQLTATMQVEGLRVGDVLRVAYSVTNTDVALKGRVQTYAPILAAPFRAGFARTRLLWPENIPLKLKGYAEGLVLNPVVRSGQKELEVMLPLAKQPEIPDDAPARFQRPPILEASTFADWSDVSRTLSPLFNTEDAVVSGGPLAQEVATIKDSESEPLRRAQRALELTQSQVRYQVMGMDGGNYVPQSPAKTWSLRYGDCKAKTLLLLSMLRGLDIEAEAVLASTQLSGLVQDRLPAPGAFDHVLVRASIGGRDYWLDGTGSGARLADIGDTPPFRMVLPLRPAGADLMPIVMRPDARPMMSADIKVDDSAILGLPSVVNVTVRLRGAAAEAVRLASSQAGADDRESMIRGTMQPWVGEMQISESDIGYDAATGTASIQAKGLVTSGWKWASGRYERDIDQVAANLAFEPDRARAAWRAIPVDSPWRPSASIRTAVTLPGRGDRFELEGGRTLPASLAGIGVTRSVQFEHGVVVVEDRLDAIGAEIAPSSLPATRAAVAQAKSRALRIVAPRDLPQRWAAVPDARRDGRIKAIDDIFAKAIAKDPDEITGYRSRASFRAGTFDFKGAIADYDKMIEIAPDADTYIRRAKMLRFVGQDQKALSDVASAREMDPSSEEAAQILIELKSVQGAYDEAIAIADEKITEGGVARFGWMAEKADVLAASGNVEEALKISDEILAARPGEAGRLNQRCWLKATSNTALESALKDCTRAIELSEQAATVLDSRALVYFRLGRMEEALADLNAALEQAPSQPESLFLRGILHKRAGRVREAETDLSGARLMDPGLDRQYARWGIRA